MPWLIKDQTAAKDNLFFVHVPRCGGTSLMHEYRVPEKVMKDRSLWGRLGMKIFFLRYKVLESTNFPWKTKGSLVSLIAFLAGIYTLSVKPNNIAVRQMAAAWTVLSVFLFLLLSFVFTAPTIGRITAIRRTYLIIVHYVLCQFMESIEWCTGTNKTGYMMHLTATKLMQHGYITEEEFQESTTMAIVRNPYSRMVSIYNYNKFGSLESFDNFVRDWYNRMTKPYRETGELDEWYTPCHTIPQHEFTHKETTPLVQSIIKQEELKLLKKSKREGNMSLLKGTSVADLPELVESALLGMPHTNSRAKGGKSWQDYYNQETLDLVYEMYQKDFEVFGYNPVMEKRTDLQAPKLYRKVTQDDDDMEAQAVLKDGVMEEKEANEQKNSTSWSMASLFALPPRLLSIGSSAGSTSESDDDDSSNDDNSGLENSSSSSSHHHGSDDEEQVAQV